MLDKYTKLMLTIIAVGIIGINIHIFKGSVIEDAYANANIENDWQMIVDTTSGFPVAFIVRDNGTKLCRITLTMKQTRKNKGTYLSTGC